MTINNKCRKLLWGKSGNLCAICKKRLTVEATEVDDESLLGEECHIRSSQINGPRYDPSYPQEKLDKYENLILLCRNDHKKVDDQFQTFDPDILFMIKAKHEEYVFSRLKEKTQPPNIKITRKAENLPKFLYSIESGGDLFNLLEGAHSLYFDHPEPKHDLEAELFSQFIREVQDWMDVLNVIDPDEVVIAKNSLRKKIVELKENRFGLFGAKEIQYMQDEQENVLSEWYAVHLRIFQLDTEEIIPNTNNGKI